MQGTAYVPPAQCAERKYFTPLLAKVLKKSAQLPVSAPQSQLLQAMQAVLPEDADNALDEIISIKSIRYGQLCPLSQPDTSLREHHANDPDYIPPLLWETYVASDDKSFNAQAPLAEGGKHYLIHNQRSWPWKVKIFASIALGSTFTKDREGEEAGAGEVDYALRVEMGKRGREHMYTPNSMKDTDYCIVLQFGEFNASTNNFVAWPTDSDPHLKSVMVADQELVHMLFYQINRTGPHWPEWVPPAESDNEVDVTDFLTQTSRQRYTLVEMGGQMAYSYTDKGTKQLEYIAVCDFQLLKLDSLYQFVEDDCGEPYAKIVCRATIKDEGSTVLLRSDDEIRTPDIRIAKFLDVEVLVQLSKLRSNADVKGLFQKFHPRLTATSMTADMLACWIAEQEKPHTTQCIVRFGRQHDDAFVSGNLWFKGDRMLTLEEAKIGIVPAYFKDQLLPVPKSDFPRNIIIPQCHVRYVIGVNFWTNLMPAFFCNNLLPAKAVFAHFVMGLYATKIWGGQCGFGHGCPFAWVYSTEPNTGKTEALLAGNSMLGFFGRNPWAGDCTKSAMNERLHQQTDLSLAVDDVVINTNAPESKVFQQMGRAIFDRSDRAVTGKLRKPHSTAIFTVPACLIHFPSPPSPHSGIAPSRSSLYHGTRNSSNHSSCVLL